VNCSQCGREFTGRGRAKFCSAVCKTRHDVNERRSWRRIVSDVKQSGVTLADALGHRGETPEYPSLADAAGELNDDQGRMAVVPDRWQSDEASVIDPGVYVSTDDEPRKDTTEPHPLFAGNVIQWHLDRLWREGAPASLLALFEHDTDNIDETDEQTDDAA
jgi:hypothetical protein